MLGRHPDQDVQMFEIAPQPYCIPSAQSIDPLKPCVRRRNQEPDPKFGKLPSGPLASFLRWPALPRERRMLRPNANRLEARGEHSFQLPLWVRLCNMKIVLCLMIRVP